MAKGYWIAHVDVSDLEGYKAYVAANAEPLRKYGGRFLVRGGTFEAPEGRSRYNSAEYQRAVALRTPHSVADILVIEGYDGPQPANG